MAESAVWRTIERSIAATDQNDFRIDTKVPVGGGSINICYQIEGNGSGYFVKLNRGDRLGMFEAEMGGLREMAASGTVRVPQAVICGAGNGFSFLVLENLQLQPGTTSSDRILGQQLAAMHRIPQAFFGWARDNTIGSTLQENKQSSDWLQFWKNQRLGFQLDLASNNGYSNRLAGIGESLSAGIDDFFRDYKPQPSLLHGDLWAGNAAADFSRRPVIFDPACYYGDREVDIAMTELFGGFGPAFYAAYNEVYPLDSGYRIRKQLYNLYHILNHLNLFGDTYLSQAQSMIRNLLAELG